MLASAMRDERQRSPPQIPAKRDLRRTHGELGRCAQAGEHDLQVALPAHRRRSVLAGGGGATEPAHELGMSSMVKSARIAPLALARSISSPASSSRPTFAAARLQSPGSWSIASDSGAVLRGHPGGLAHQGRRSHSRGRGRRAPRGRPRRRRRSARRRAPGAGPPWSGSGGRRSRLRPRRHGRSAPSGRRARARRTAGGPPSRMRLRLRRASARCLISTGAAGAEAFGVVVMSILVAADSS